MKSIVLLIIISLTLINHSDSQSWDNNTTWVFETVEFGPPIEGNYLTYKVHKDTIIGGNKFFRIHSFYQNSPTSMLIRNRAFSPLLSYENERVYFFDQSDSSTNLIYDFSLNQGDSYLAYCDLGRNYFKVNIDSTDVFLQNGEERKVQFVSSENIEGCYFSGKIVEGMGFENHLFPIYTFVDPPPGGHIKCYKESSFSYPSETICDVIVSSDEIAVEKINIYPNPAQDYINVKGIGSAPYAIYNSMGQIIQRGEIKKKTLNTSQLENGIYVLALRIKNRKHLVKFIKLN